MRARTLHGISLILGLSTNGLAQEAAIGEVSFITAQHVYVKFAGTAGIAANDTLDLLVNGAATPCLVVSSLSSTSCVCTAINGCKPGKGAAVRTRNRRAAAGAPSPARPTPSRKEPVEADSLHSSGERIRGRLSAATYSTIPSLRENDHRVMYRLWLDADNIAGSKFSAEAYLNYRKLYPANIEKHPQGTEFFNAYTLAVTCAPDPRTSITIGRKINNNAASLGAIDGLQLERLHGKVFAGILAGTRPDPRTFGLNPGLLQYGGYIGMRLSSATVNSSSTAGLLQQTNQGMTDRRFAYLQHSSTYKGNLNLFLSGELDLYSTIGSAVRLTNLYVSSRYRISRKVDAFASYDSRRRVIYYETFRTEVEELLEDDEARQGARIRLNVRPTRKLGAGIAYSKRFQADGANASDNLGANVNLNLDPEGAGRWAMQANRNITDHVRCDVLSFRHSRTLVPKHVNASIYYRVVEYNYPNRSDGSPLVARTSQRYYGADIAVSLPHSIVFTALGELSTIRDEKNYRVNFSLTKRFDSKKRK
ncbi:MAG: hypothetical protein ACK4L7_06210 [Flavobacteriales bacterium]